MMYSFEQWCLDNDHKDYLDLWDYELNDNKPSDISYGSSKKYYFRCKNNIHKSELWLICSITGKSVTCNIACRMCNSFGQYLIDEYGEDGIKTYWSDKNTINPFEIQKRSKKCVFIKCLTKGHPDYKTSCNTFFSGVRCGVCKNKIVIRGINDIATTNSELIDYFVNKDEAYKYSYSSNKKVLVKCKECGFQKHMSIDKLYNRGFSCNRCSDGISYPEKYIMCLLSQINVDFKTQLSKKNLAWCRNYKYDFYIRALELIVETNGGRHYSSAGIGKTLIEEQNNDKLKKELALSNGINHYVELDCRKSEMEWIKNSVMNSELPSLLNFIEDDIDWAECSVFATKNIVIDVCNYYNDNKATGLNYEDISNKFNISVTTMYRYLKIGTGIGICELKNKKQL